MRRLSDAMEATARTVARRKQPYIELLQGLTAQWPAVILVSTHADLVEPARLIGEPQLRDFGHRIFGRPHDDHQVLVHGTNYVPSSDEIPILRELQQVEREPWTESLLKNVMLEIERRGLGLARSSADLGDSAGRSSLPWPPACRPVSKGARAGSAYRGWAASADILLGSPLRRSIVAAMVPGLLGLAAWAGGLVWVGAAGISGSLIALGSIPAVYLHGKLGGPARPTDSDPVAPAVQTVSDHDAPAMPANHNDHATSNNGSLVASGIGNDSGGPASRI